MLFLNLNAFAKRLRSSRFRVVFHTLTHGFVVCLIGVFTRGVNALILLQEIACRIIHISPKEIL